MSLIVREFESLPYAAGLALQEELVARKLAGDHDDYLLVLEHEAVFTLGRGADARDLRGADVALGVEAVRVSRGGGVTFHGPGQLVAYPIIALDRGARDVRRYVWRLEQVLIGVCGDFGIPGTRRDGLTGVWVEDAKIAAIGIGVRRWTTFHGVALNVSTELRYFSRIVPCRQPNARVTSMAVERGAAPPMAAVRAAVVRQFRAVFGYAADVEVNIWPA